MAEAGREIKMCFYCLMTMASHSEEELQVIMYPPSPCIYYVSFFKTFQIHGMVRIVMKPLITKMPLVGGLQIFFLNNPSIDFNLVGAADILDMPGFR